MGLVRLILVFLKIVLSMVGFFMVLLVFNSVLKGMLCEFGMWFVCMSGCGLVVLFLN